MAFIRDHFPEDGKPEEKISTKTGISAEEKRMLYSIAEPVPKKGLDLRTIGLMILAAVIGFLSAVILFNFL